MKTLDRLQPYVLSLLRIIVGLLFMQHGLSKLFGFPAGAGFPAFLSLPWFEGWIEMIGGGLLVIGLFTRFAALIASGENWRGHDDVMQTRSIRGSGEPVWVIALLKCALTIGTRSAQSIMASGFTAAQTGRTHDRTRPMLQQLRTGCPATAAVCRVASHQNY